MKLAFEHDEKHGFSDQLSNNANGNAPLPTPMACGIPLKYISLITLAAQNSVLAVVMHYSRVSVSPSHAYSAATAVLMTELLKGSISLCIAFLRVEVPPTVALDGSRSHKGTPSVYARLHKLYRDIFSSDCWKLSIPAILYVIQNNLQFVAASNLDAATFQVTYQMKILTTAGFSVLMLRKKLSFMQWISLFFLAIGVGIVQLQSIGETANTSSSGESTMNRMKGLLAVMAACMTSGLAGVYFEMVLKTTQADLWIRNVQLSLFSLLPALMPILFSHQTTSEMSVIDWITSLFDNFGPWAWATVFIQVLGGLVTAMVIKYSDNILKGFATSLSIVASFLASVALFNHHISVPFILGSTIVINATTLYNQNPKKFLASGSGKEPTLLVSWNDGMRTLNGIKSPAVERPTGDYTKDGVLFHTGSRTSSGSSISVVVTPPSPIIEYP